MLKSEVRESDRPGKTVLVLGSFAESLTNFRGSLLRTLASAGNLVIASAPDASESVRHRLAELGAVYEPVYLQRQGLNPFQDVVTLFSIWRILRRYRPDVVLFYTIKPVVYGSLITHWMSCAKIFSMITGTGYPFSTPANWLQRVTMSMAKMLYRGSLRHNQGVFFQNPDDLSLFQQHDLVRDRAKTIIVNGSGVDLAQFSPVSFPAKTSFLLIARLLKEKGIIEYAEAAHQLRGRYPDTRFRLVGWHDSGSASIPSELLDRRISDGTLEFLGRLDDVRPAIAGCTVYVLPSYREGTPRTVLEAMAMGRPIITTDVPGCRETVKDGENGFLVPHRDVSSLVQTMERFLVNPGLAETMGRRSRELAEAKYDVHKVNEVLMSTMGLKRSP